MKTRYGLAYEDYLAMLNGQDGVCAICHQHETYEGLDLSIDHDHSTGKVRGLLCQSCNTGLGKFRDSVELLERAKLYLIERS
jgi:hypothetical protein